MVSGVSVCSVCTVECVFVRGVSLLGVCIVCIVECEFVLNGVPA